ncbi:MAG TPA: substrate-binding domain-containing protein [Acidimicrobiales bacterium]|jgi:ribose transport system substrate-binding protein|nr:substrate-binding domain-containing protein [Acidimicrobiales bacterium]HEX2562806.1 substrate-binding domain-containing protein [Acidimicrobiales bacterium]
MIKPRWKRTVGLAAVTVLLVGACESGDDDEASDDEAADSGAEAEGGGVEEGETITIAFSAPGADHGWLAAITENAEEEAASHDDVDFVLLEGTNDSASQVAQVEQLIAEDPDVLIILPHEGDPLTPVALEAMESGIPVVNVDREFASEGAYRTWIGGDNYGIGVSAAEYIAEQLDCQGNVVEIQGVAGISVTELRTAGFADTIEQLCGDGISIVAQQPADFLPDQGLEVMETILQAESDIDAVYTHDDDMAMGVVSAIENAGREDEMILTGAGGSQAAMEMIQEGGLYAATFLYNPSMSASAVRVARLIALGEGFEELVEPEVPSRIELPATTVTADNVDQFVDLGF